MNGQIGALLRAAVAFKATQVKQAAYHYVEDRADHAKRLAIGYAVAATMFAIAGLLFIGACVIGMIALYAWLLPQYAVFGALGICAGVLVALMMICIIVAMIKMRSRPATYPSLGDRVGSAIKGNPLAPAVQASKVKAASALSAVAGSAEAATSRVSEKARHISDEREGPRALRRARRTALDVLQSPSPLDNRPGRLQRAGLALGAGLLGWALVRRRRNEFAQTVSKP